VTSNQPCTNDTRGSSRVGDPSVAKCPASSARKASRKPSKLSKPMKRGPGCGEVLAPPAHAAGTLVHAEREVERSAATDVRKREREEIPVAGQGLHPPPSPRWMGTPPAQLEVGQHALQVHQISVAHARADGQEPAADHGAKGGSARLHCVPDDGG
jgi:hypothetical protein